MAEILELSISSDEASNQSPLLFSPSHHPGDSYDDYEEEEEEETGRKTHFLLPLPPRYTFLLPAYGGDP